ncbi:MAG: heterodisulfide reductase-related iron-sulfur binding cluster [Halofilum sp. (in: g-proteobacteria)]|nr:heterodisulfide reductase-related iron-sulfur binding cluster [Halofilum sp. (in: g-proteobacteria)]
MPGIDAHTARVLTELGIEVVRDRRPAGCCGAIDQHLGYPERARAQRIATTVDAWQPALDAGADAIVSERHRLRRAGRRVRARARRRPGLRRARAARDRARDRPGGAARALRRRACARPDESAAADRLPAPLHACSTGSGSAGAPRRCSGASASS